MIPFTYERVNTPAEAAKAVHLIQKGQLDEAAEGNGLTARPEVAELLRLVAFDLRHPLDFFPKDWAKIADQDLLQLKADVRTALASRLKTTKVVSWHRLHDRLSKMKPDTPTLPSSEDRDSLGRESSR